MNIRKHWKKLLLTTTAFFWTSCTSENEAVFPTIAQDVPPAIHPEVSSDSNGDSVLESSSSANEAETSSSETASEISSSETATKISSSEKALSSSSKAAQSSSSKISGYGTYKLARDTSVTCEVSETQTFIMGSGKQSPEEIMDDLENNKTRSIEELNELEDKLEFESLNYGALYGVPSVSTGIKPSKYTCSNDSSYSASVVQGRGSMLYSNKEYEEKFPTPVPSPLCQKTNFMSNGVTEELGVNKSRFVGDMIVEYNTDKQALVDSAKSASSEALSEAQKQCLDRDITTISAYSGPIASKQICDGDTIVNPRYQAKLDSNKAFINRQIEKCLNE